MTDLSNNSHSRPSSLSSLSASELFALWMLILCWTARFAILSLPDLVDPSEGRFAGSALRMLLTGDWIVPEIHEFGGGWVPYQAKPPFHIWLTALSLATFGINEFGARFPSFLATLICTIMIGLLGSWAFGKKVGLLGSLIFFSSSGILIFAPSCLTDANLSACVITALISFLICTSSDLRSDQQFLDSSRARWWFGHLFFLALGIGMLVKGPIAVVLAGFPIFFWILFTKRWRTLRRLPWITGVLLFSAISIPWYWEAEKRNPGFLQYFFLRENFGRFLTHKFGIRYGSAHKAPYGTIWLFFSGVFFPWILLVFRAVIVKERQETLRMWMKENPFFLFVVCWGIFPLLFFTIARNILPTYTFPAIGGWALTLAYALVRWEKEGRSWVSQRFLQNSTLILSSISVGVILFCVLWGKVALFPLATLGFVQVCFLIVRKQRGNSCAYDSLIQFAACLAICTCAIAAVTAPSISQSRSMGPILREVQKTDSTPRAPLVVLYSDPRSAHFYGMAFFGLREEMNTGNDVATLPSFPMAHVLVRDNDEHQVGEQYRSGLTLLNEQGPWHHYLWNRKNWKAHHPLK